MSDRQRGGHGTEQPRRRKLLVERTLFLDVFLDQRTRPLVIYVPSIIGVGAAAYHWLEG